MTLNDTTSLPTCDNPVVLCGIDGDKLFRIPPSYGVKGKDKAILFPVSPTKALLGTYTRHYKWKIQADEYMAMMLRKAIVDNSLMFIYGNHEDSDIPMIKPRVIDPQEYKRYTHQFETWFEKYRTVEGPLLTNYHSLS